MTLKTKRRNIGVWLAALAFGAIQSNGCCVRPETIADTLRIQDAYATAELCSSLDLSRENEHFQQECREAKENYQRLLEEVSTGCAENACDSSYGIEAR